MFGWGVKTVTAAELANRLEAGRPAVVDVREPYEFAEGHIPEAVNIPLGSLKERASELAPDAETYLICASGHRSATAAKGLKALGFTDAYSVKGGMAGWRGKVKR